MKVYYASQAQREWNSWSSLIEKVGLAHMLESAAIWKRTIQLLKDLLISWYRTKNEMEAVKFVNRKWWTSTYARICANLEANNKYKYLITKDLPFPWYRTNNEMEAAGMSAKFVT